MSELTITELEDKDVMYLIGYTREATESEVSCLVDVVAGLNRDFDRASARLVPGQISDGEIVELDKEDLEEIVDE